VRIKDDLKREAIIQKTLAIVNEQGIAGVKMADLAKSVGVSVSTLYVYFKNKEDLIITISVELFSKISEMSTKDISDNLPYKLKLKSLWLYWVNYSINHTLETNFMHQVKQSPYYQKIPTSILEAKHKIYKLKSALREMEKFFDDIYIDTAPALNFYTRSALIAADKVLIPFDCDDFSRKALYQIMGELQDIQEDHNEGLQVEGIVVNQFQPRASLPQKLVAELIEEGLPVLDVKLSSSVKMKESLLP